MSRISLNFKWSFARHPLEPIYLTSYSPADCLSFIFVHECAIYTRCACHFVEIFCNALWVSDAPAASSCRGSVPQMDFRPSFRFLYPVMYFFKPIRLYFYPSFSSSSRTGFASPISDPHEGQRADSGGALAPQTGHSVAAGAGGSSKTFPSEKM